MMLSVGQLELMSLPSYKEIITSIHTYVYIYGYIEYTYIICTHKANKTNSPL